MQSAKKSGAMKNNPHFGQRTFHHAAGKIGWILLWMIGIPVPVLLGLFLIRGCT